MKSMPSIGHSMMKHKKKLSLDLSEKDLANVSINDEVTITVKGKVSELRAKEEMTWSENKKDKTVYPPRIELEVSSVKVEEENAFAKMAASDNDDEEG